MTMTASAVDSPSAAPDRIGPGAGFWPATVAVAKRTVLKFIRTPQVIAFAAIQTVVFLVLFRYVFGGAISVQGQRYVDFLVPGFVATTALVSGVGAAIGVAEDVEHGFFDRLRSLPVYRLSVLTGRCLADTALVTWSLGFAAALGFAFGWMFITIGLVSGSGQAARG